MKKIVTYLVTLGMMISMVPSSVSAADTTPETIAVTEESTEKNADREGAAVAVMNNLNVILSLTEGADSNLDDYTKVTDERFKTIDSVKKFISENCTGDLEDEFLKKCEKSLIEKEDGLYKRNSGRFYSIFLTDNGVEIVEPAMDAFIAVTKKRDQMNNYGGVLFKVEGSKWKAKSIESGFFTVNNSESDLESAAYIMAENLNSIYTMLSYSAPEDSTDTITDNGITYGRVKEEWQNNILDYLKETINENCTGDLKDSLLYQAEYNFVEKNGVLYSPIGARDYLNFNIEGGLTVSDISNQGFTVTTKKSNDKDGYAKIVFVAEDEKWRIKNYRFLSTLENAVDPKELAGRWIMEASDGRYAVDMCSNYQGAIIINEDGTYTYTSESGDITTGKISSSYEEFPYGKNNPVIFFFENETSSEFGGYYFKEENSIYFGTDGMSRMVRDDNYDKELSKIAIERIENYQTIHTIVSGGLEYDDKVQIEVNAIPYYKVTDKKFNSIVAIKRFINENTAGDMNISMHRMCDDKFIEEKGVLYERCADRDVTTPDTSKGVIITNKTDNSFKAITIAPNNIPGSGHIGASFIAEDDTWKISDYEYDTYACNRSFDDFNNCASLRVSKLLYCMEYIERAATETENDKIKINGVEYVKDGYQMYTIDDLKKEVKDCCTGVPRENLLSRIDARFIEKDGSLYRKAEAGLAIPDFVIYKGMKVTAITSEDKFKAATVGASDKDGYGVFEFVKEGDKFLLSSYSFSIFNEERLFGGYVDTQSGGLNLREKPNTSSTILAEIPKGTQLDIYESDTSGWYKVAYNGKIGYVSADYIKVIPSYDIPVETTTAVTTSSATTTTTTTTTTPAAKQKGDVNGDGSINLKDVVMIRRYIAGGWNVTIDEKIADINKDGTVNLKDVVLLRRYIAGGWNVEL